MESALLVACEFPVPLLLDIGRGRTIEQGTGIRSQESGVRSQGSGVRRGGTGFDWGLASEDNLFQASARLAVSGIRRGSAQYLNVRLKERMAQTKSGPCPSKKSHE